MPTRNMVLLSMIQGTVAHMAFGLQRPQIRSQNTQQGKLRALAARRLQKQIMIPVTPPQGPSSPIALDLSRSATVDDLDPAQPSTDYTTIFSRGLVYGHISLTMSCQVHCAPSKKLAQGKPWSQSGLAFYGHGQGLRRL